ncbi:hypothetical protein C8Q76DRAFT_692054 [Earliella scabrosa]|nr:hypothetical protein C8Q76DRAFT_692054 [Earliella scabrosa]
MSGYSSLLLIILTPHISTATYCLAALVDPDTTEREILEDVAGALANQGFNQAGSVAGEIAAALPDLSQHKDEVKVEDVIGNTFNSNDNVAGNQSLPTIADDLYASEGATVPASTISALGLNLPSDFDTHTLVYTETRESPCTKAVQHQEDIQWLDDILAKGRASRQQPNGPLENASSTDQQPVQSPLVHINTGFSESSVPQELISCTHHPSRPAALVSHEIACQTPPHLRQLRKRGFSHISDIESDNATEWEHPATQTSNRNQARARQCIASSERQLKDEQEKLEETRLAVTHQVAGWRVAMTTIDHHHGDQQIPHHPGADHHQVKTHAEDHQDEAHQEAHQVEDHRGEVDH